jgi:predicted heme/steroid binding protein
MRIRRLAFSIALLPLIVGVAACTPQSSAGTLELTLEELAEFDGQSGRDAYIAVNGVIYDVTDADNWENGRHQGMLLAGTDATSVIASAPHGTSVLSDLPIVGSLVDE